METQFVRICKCKQCDILYIDERLDQSTRKYEIEVNSMDYLVGAKGFVDTICPVCETGQFLMPVEGDIEPQYYQTFESIEIWKYREVD